jgi:hypothetical protein
MIVRLIFIRLKYKIKILNKIYEKYIYIKLLLII